MAFEKISNSINELNENLKAFSQSNAEYYKLEFFKQAMKGATVMVKVLVVGVFGLFALIILSIATAIAISEAIGSPSSGFFIVGGFYILLIILYFLIGEKPITKMMLQKFSRSFFN